MLPSFTTHPPAQYVLTHADNHEGAKIYAQNAIRKRAEALNYLRLASRLDAVVSRLDTQAKMQVRGEGGWQEETRAAQGAAV